MAIAIIHDLWLKRLWHSMIGTTKRHGDEMTGFNGYYMSNGPTVFGPGTATTVTSPPPGADCPNGDETRASGLAAVRRPGTVRCPLQRDTKGGLSA